MTEHQQRGVIFDLDGTLLNTLEDLAESMNIVLSQMGWSTHPTEAYRKFVGNGMDMLVQRALPEKHRQKSTATECLRAMRREYARRWAKTTRPYSGITALLDQLASQQCPMAVLSNKPDDATQEMVKHFFPRVDFHGIAGAQTGKPKKPDPAMALQLSEIMGLSPGATLFLGDSNTDIQTARAAGMVALGAGWGFRGPAELLDAGAAEVLDAPLKLLNWLE
ncbi:MAG TPA: HAD family hydrolase [Desulfonatronum sp.]|nr:HAD family hydrolase [Desulfonatronum sp.]